MKLLPIILLFIIATTHSCDSNFNFDPSKAYPILEIEDYWVNKFNQGGLQNAKIFEDRLFCNTINITKGQDFLYCLSLATGKVIWKFPVKWYASQPVEIYNNTIYFATVLGNIYNISIEGKLIWEQKLPAAYSGHTVNPTNGNLIVSTVVDGAYELNSETGEIIYHYEYQSKSGVCHLTQPIFYQNNVIFGNAPMDASSGKEALLCVDNDTKQVKWKTLLYAPVTPYEEQGFLLIDHYVLILDRVNRVFCFDANTGNNLWIKEPNIKYINIKWILYSKLVGKTVIDPIGIPIALNVETGEGFDYKEADHRDKYTIDKNGVKYDILIEDRVKTMGLDISIEQR